MELQNSQEAQFLPTDQRDALYQLKYWPAVARIMHIDRVSAGEAHSVTATFYSAICMYTNHCSRHMMLWVSSIYSRTINLTVTVIISFLWHRISTSAPWWTQTTLAEVHKIFGGKASKPETSRPVENAIFTYNTCIWRSHWGWSHWNFIDLLHHETSLWAIVQHCLRDPMFSDFGTVPACDRQMDRQTDMQRQQVPC